MQHRGAITHSSPQKAEIDIHQMTRDVAMKHLELYLNRVGGNVTEVSVIHGHNNGTVLRDMVRKSLRHPRIAARYASLNPGVTILVLNKK